MAFETLPNHDAEDLQPSGEAIGMAGAELRAVTEPLSSNVVDVRIALARGARATSVIALNQILADTMMLRDLYKKHHWQASGATFYQLHVLFDKHYEEQVAMIDAIAGRIQILGGTA